MGADNQPKHRRIARDLRRKSAIRNRIERLLIVCEGSKTEPQYIDEIRQDLRLTTTHIRVIGPGYGTDPLSVVDYAEHLFLNGDRRQNISPREFDRIVTVFDRDDHEKYYPALEKILTLEKKLINDEKVKVSIEAVVSVPCFELWLLLHYEDVYAAIHRYDVYDRLKLHIQNYDKGQSGLWKVTRPFFDMASNRAARMANLTTRYDGVEPYTDMHHFVARLLALKTVVVGIH